jgi:acyl-CoA synthetase (AMP-forming)/AMP-acid ligase II
MLQGRTLWKLLEQRVNATPDALMMVDEDMRTLTFAEFWVEAERAAAGLHSAGVHAGHVVSWQLPTWIESMVLAAALSRLGVVQNPISPSCREAELTHITARSQLLVIPSIWEGFDYEQMATELAQANGSIRLLIADRALPQGDTAVLEPLAENLQDDEPAASWIFYTSAAQGKSKGVLHSDATLIAAARALSLRVGLIGRDRNSLVGELSDVNSILWLFASLLSGCSNILIDSFHPEESIEVLSRENVTLAGTGLEFHQAYVVAQRAVLHPVFGDVRAFVGSGHQKPADLVEEVRALFDVPVLGGYGPTEAPMLTVADLSDSPSELAGTDGKPTGGVEIRLVQADNTIVVDGSEGELRVRAPQMMLGYLDGTVTAEAFDDDGFFRTGDVGCIDDRGNLRVTGRLVGVELNSPLH